jgi:hypothetical protein
MFWTINLYILLSKSIMILVPDYYINVLNLHVYKSVIEPD